MTAFRNIDDVKAANRARGGCWFDPATLRGFGSRVHDALYGGRFFVTSERRPAGFRTEAGPRLYTVREAHGDGSISTVGAFQGYRSRRSAHNAARSFGAVFVP
jgi:hypothetical protein